MKGLVQLFLFRWREFYREPQILFWALIFPLGIMVILGLAFRPKPPEPMPVLVAASPQDPIVAALETSTYDGQHALKVIAKPLAEAENALRRGDAAVLVIPGPPIVYRFDETHPEARQTRLLIDRALRPEDPIARDENKPARGSRYIDWLVPGLLGMQIMNGSLWGVGFALVEMRSKKLLKRFAVTPMKRGHFLLATALYRFLVVGIEAVLMFAFAMVAFKVPLSGSALAFGVVAGIGTFSMLTLALLVAARPRNTEVAAGIMNIPMLPQMFMSGVFFSSTRFPDVMQPVIKTLPLTALIDGLRRIANEGGGIESVSREIVVLAVWAVVLLVLALRSFRWS
jgi:ABC-type multidrug transport system permease subunit